MKPAFSHLLHLLTVLSIFTSCSTTKKSSGSRDDHKIELTFVQINDVYEIAPLSNGKEGGMARVATLKKEYKQKNPNTLLVIAGDFVSPSVYNSLQYQGKPIRGKQMIESMNAAGMDLAVFGNHEFDIKENELQDRIDESNFKWISSNTFHFVNGQPVPFKRSTGEAFPKTFILQIKDADGTTAKVGFIGLTLPFNKADYVRYTDALQTAKELYTEIKDSVDAVVAITHQSLEEDEQLAKEVPGLAAIIGGHEHDQRFKKVGKIYITKALANAKSAYIIHLHINKKNHKLKVVPELRKLNEEVALDSATNSVVNKWNDIANSNYSSLGFDAKKIVITEGEPLDGRESEIRNHPTNLTKLTIASMKHVVPTADVMLLNAGSIRVDDILQMPVTEYDIIRSLPFGGSIREVDMKGGLLMKVLDQGEKNVNIGGFLLHNDDLVHEGGGWMLNKTSIDSAKVYHVALGEFILTGKEANLDFLNPSNPGIVKVYDPAPAGDPRSDIRLAIVKYLTDSASHR